MTSTDGIGFQIFNTGPFWLILTGSGGAGIIYYQGDPGGGPTGPFSPAAGLPQAPTGILVDCGQVSLAAPVATAATNITGSGFSANWNASSGATGYKLDVSTDPNFGSYVGGYQNLDVGNVTTYAVTGLSGTTNYHYRLRAYNVILNSQNSNIIDATTTLACYPVPSGIIAWFRAEGNIIDFEGNVTGATSGVIQYPAGKVPVSAFYFDATLPYISLGTSAPLQLTTFTIELWRKRAVAGRVGNGSHAYGQFIAWTGTPAGGGFNFYEQDTGQTIIGAYGKSNLMLSNPSIYPTQDTNWHHVACAIDSTNNKGYLWVDGVADPKNPYTLNGPNTPPYFSYPGQTVAIPCSTGDGILGAVDELSVYNRVLTNAEILGIYTASYAGKCTS